MEEFAREYGARGGQGAPSPAESKTSNERTVILPVDMEEEDGAYVLLADVPGLEKSALSVRTPGTSITASFLIFFFLLCPGREWWLIILILR